MSTYLVTGVAGFIGTRVTQLLLEAGHRVLGVDNLNDSYDIRLKQWRLSQLRQQPGLCFQQLDICDRQLLRRLLELLPEQPAAIVNLAGRAGVRQSASNPWAYIETNTTGTLNLLDLCHEYGIAKFVQASTSSLYGRTGGGRCDERACTDHPLSPYAASKKAAEALCHSYHSLYGIDVSILRYFTVYGPAGRPDMSLFRFVQWVSEERPVVIFGDGRQLRDFTFVDDVARGTIAALRPLGYEVINLGSDLPVVLIEALRLVEELVGRKSRLVFKSGHPADVPSSWANTDKARRLLGWRPVYDLRAGLRSLVEWYQEHRVWASDLATA